MRAFLLLFIFLFFGDGGGTASSSHEQMLAKCSIKFIETCFKTHLDTDMDERVTADEFDMWANSTRCGTNDHNHRDYGFLTGDVLISICKATNEDMDALTVADLYAPEQHCLDSTSILHRVCTKCIECNAYEDVIKQPELPDTEEERLDLFMQAYQAYLLEQENNK